MKRLVVIFCILILSIGAFAQENPVGSSSFKADPFNHPMMPLYLIFAFLFIVLILVGVVAIYIIKILNMLTIRAEKEKAIRQGVVYIPRATWWSRFLQTMNAHVPLEREKNIELDHNYDGIKELDNHLPPWWKWLFYGTVAWSAVYLFIFHVSKSLPLSEDEYQNEVVLAEVHARQLKALQPQAEIDENSLTFIPDSISFISNGKTVFMDNNCGSCHRVDGGGSMIGPNLTDEYWLHGGHIKDVFLTIKNGVVEKGMPAWGKSLNPKQVRDVTFFVLSLQGSKPADAKSPQGEIFRQTIIENDSSKVQAGL